MGFCGLDLSLLLLNINYGNYEANDDTTKDKTKQTEEGVEEATWKNWDTKNHSRFVSTWIQAVKCQGDAGRDDPGQDYS